MKEGSGVAIHVLTNLTIDSRKVVAAVEQIVLEAVETEDYSRGNPSTPRAKKVIEYAMTESRNFKHGYVGTEHILLGLMCENEGVAAQVLEGFGLRVQLLRTEIENLLRQPRDWRRQPPLPQFPATWANQADKGSVDLPAACPKCHQPVVRVIWGWVRLFGRNLEDVTAGRAILGSPVDKGGPPWVCLQCTPKWSEAHRLALQEHEMQVEKVNAIVAAEFEKAARIRDMQTEGRRRLILLLAELSREQ